MFKGRAVYLPAENPTYSFGIGYERLIKQNLSLQLLYNNTRFTSGYDAKTSETQGIVSEVRYYFGKKKDVRKKLFIGGFIEFYRYKEFGGMPSYAPDYYLIESNGNIISPRILIGKNNAIGKHFLIDIGFRAKIKNGIYTFKRDNGERFFKGYKDMSLAARLGLNFGYLF